MKAAVFLDRDGTLVRNVHHGADPLAAEVLGGIVPALAALQHFGYGLVIVSNHSGVARELFSVAEARQAARYLCAWLNRHHIRLDGFYFCPHRPAADGRVTCDCRKPAPGMLLAAAESLALDLARSWLIGDTLADWQAAQAAGCRCILVAQPLAMGANEVMGGSRPIVARSLPHAAGLLLSTDGRIAWSPPPTLTHGARGEWAAGPRLVGDASPWPDEHCTAQAERDGAWLLESLDRLIYHGDRRADPGE